MTFQPLAQSDLAGALKWTKPAQDKTTGLFASGFTANTAASGAIYTLTTNFPALTYTTPVAARGDLHFRGAALPDLDAVLSISTADKATVDLPNANKVSVTITRKSGLLGGSFTPTGATKAIKFTGVLQQRQNVGGCYFPGAAQSGTVEFVPR